MHKKMHFLRVFHWIWHNFLVHCVLNTAKGKSAMLPELQCSCSSRPYSLSRYEGQPRKATYREARAFDKPSNGLGKNAASENESNKEGGLLHFWTLRQNFTDTLMSMNFWCRKIYFFATSYITATFFAVIFSVKLGSFEYSYSCIKKISKQGILVSHTESSLKNPFSPGPVF